MKYFIDTEFIEGFYKPLFGKRRHFIDLISIGIVAEDGREFYAISKEFKYADADGWVQENVIKPLYYEEAKKDWNRFKYLSGYSGYGGFSKSNLKTLLKYKGWTNKEIMKGIIDFVRPGIMQRKDNFDYNQKDEFYAYYADYDWVVFCSLFGRMVDLPYGFPMYCNDLKQSLDTYVNRTWLPESKKYMKGSGIDITFDLSLEKLKSLDTYPKQKNEHNALDDAKWNYGLFKFLSKV